MREFIKVMPTRADQYADLLEKNQIVLERLRGTCALDKETLLKLGVTGSAAARGRRAVGSAQGAPVLEL